MSEATTNFGLPLIQTGQAQKDVTHNDALSRIDRLLGSRVESRTTTTPPAAPSVGAAWIVPVSADGIWAGHESAFAEWDGSAWQYSNLPLGFICWIVDEAILCARTDFGWTARLPVEGLAVDGRVLCSSPPSSVAEPSGGSVVDAEARAVIVQLLQALRDQGMISA